MRKRWLLPLLPLILLVGCKVPTRLPNAAFRCRADITYQEMQLSGKLTRTEDGEMTFTLTSPETLDGLTMLWDGEKCSVSYGVLSFSLDSDLLPESGAGKAIMETVDAAMAVKSVSRKGKVSTVSGENYTLTYDDNTGDLISLSAPDYSLEVTFSDFE